MGKVFDVSHHVEKFRKIFLKFFIVFSKILYVFSKKTNQTENEKPSHSTRKM